MAPEQLNVAFATEKVSRDRPGAPDSSPKSGREPWGTRHLDLTHSQTARMCGPPAYELVGGKMVVTTLACTKLTNAEQTTRKNLAS